MIEFFPKPLDSEIVYSNHDEAKNKILSIIEKLEFSRDVKPKLVVSNDAVIEIQKNFIN